VTAATILDALGDGTRREILERVRLGARTVGEVADGLPVSRPAVSQHLRVLLDAGLVTVTAEGTRRYYSPDAEGFAPLRAYVDSFWTEPLARFKERAEATAPPRPRSRHARHR
jgi:DNA-binding transcriptional ArsR family regulator